MLGGSQPLATVTGAAVHRYLCTTHGVCSPGCAPWGGTLARWAMSPALLNSCPTKGPTLCGASLSMPLLLMFPPLSFLSGCLCVVSVFEVLHVQVWLCLCFCLGSALLPESPHLLPPSVLSSGIRHMLSAISSFLPLPPSGLASECSSLKGRWGQRTEGCWHLPRTARSPWRASSSPSPGPCGVGQRRQV